MKGSFFQRHLIEESYRVAKPWQQQVELEAPSKPTNAEFEPWTTDMEHVGLSQSTLVDGLLGKTIGASKVANGLTTSGEFTAPNSHEIKLRRSNGEANI
jgi:hypothetical protein